MKLPPDVLIAWQKITGYLLARRVEDDKSIFLALAGYTQATADQLLEDLWRLADEDATFVEATEYGDKYEIRGKLKGPNGRELNIVSIWMIETTGQAKFVTLYPDKP